MSELKYRMINVGGVPAGILGLDEVFSELIEADRQPEDEGTGDRLIAGVRRHNFIPKPAVDDYRQALLREYQSYYRSYQDGQGGLSKDYGQWEGHPREHIPWFPSIALELCDGCGKCIEVCPKDVFMKNEKGAVVVIEPFLCIVGCCFCKSACEPQAILMPNREMLDQYRHHR